MDSLFEYRNCPSCGRNDFEVLFESNMQDCDFREAVETVYMIPGGKYGRHVKCRNCHLIYVNPIEKASKINEVYFQRKNGDASIIRQPRLNATEAQVGLIKRHGNGSRLLDIGCGEGFFLFNASKVGYTGKGVELSQDAVQYARKEFGLDVEARPLEELQFPENNFDVVTLWEVLEHVPYPLATLKEVHRILKPGGLLVVSTPNIEGIPAKVLRKRWWEIRRLHINQFTTETLMDIVKKTGFKNISSVYYKESVSLLYLFIPILKYLKLYESLKASLYPPSILGRIMNKIMIAYSSKLNYSTVIGFK